MFRTPRPEWATKTARFAVAKAWSGLARMRFPQRQSGPTAGYRTNRHDGQQWNAITGWPGTAIEVEEVIKVLPEILMAVAQACISVAEEYAKVQRRGGCGSGLAAPRRIG